LAICPYGYKPGSIRRTVLCSAGKSGSGKTQLLELIAGLEHPDDGTIVLDNVDITRQRIQDRKVGIVFQDYAVFPHMTVFWKYCLPAESQENR